MPLPLAQEGIANTRGVGWRGLTSSQLLLSPEGTNNQPRANPSAGRLHQPGSWSKKKQPDRWPRTPAKGTGQALGCPSPSHGPSICSSSK